MQHTRPSAPTSARVSLSGLLNMLNRISAQNGQVLFMMTNKHSSLDLVLCRPGWMWHGEQARDGLRKHENHHINIDVDLVKILTRDTSSICPSLHHRSLPSPPLPLVLTFIPAITIILANPPSLAP
jgi:hypothetical protein